ncbi:glycosyltransferase family 2 protein [Streptococcus suis]|uniref:glycosyltransferase family 2 protein n=1 Tax=Streptococcus suis TaxID=1307 RepID=UPI0023D7B963|nr:glycosyltransferase [Streptococcus suis]
MEKISVIVPVYNVELYLKDCLDSIISQTYRNLEIILVDDGSTDLSLEICQEYIEKDARFKLHTLKHQGVSVARNEGIHKSTSKYIMFVDSDDIIENNLVELLYENMIKNDSDLSGCLLSTFVHDKEILETMRPKINLNTIVTVSNMGNDNFEELYNKGIFSTPVCKLYKKDYIVELFDAEQWFGEDLIFNLNYLLKIKRVSYIDKDLYWYRKGIKSTVSTFKNDIFLQVERVYESSMALFTELFGSECDLSVLEKSANWQFFYYGLLMFKHGKQSFFEKIKLFRYFYSRRKFNIFKYTLIFFFKNILLSWSLYTNRLIKRRSN